VDIQALSTGTVRIRTTMARGRGPTPLRQLRMLTGGDFTGPLPINAWLIRHPDGPLLIDTGELSETADVPFARFSVSEEDEIDRLLAGAGVAPQELRRIVLTHLHGDHANGLARLGGVPVAASARALRGPSRVLRRAGSSPAPISLDGGPVGAFPRSAALTADGSVLAVPTPGHARGHIAVLVLREDHHVLIAGDSVYSEEQLLALAPDGVSASARVAVASMRTIRAHADRHPTILLPSHDPGAARRLAEGTTIGQQRAAVA
jgi:glyoxylase-like metal-dependent hydrolase (beta-lactamase superfamily II)